MRQPSAGAAAAPDPEPRPGRDTRAPAARRCDPTSASAPRARAALPIACRRSRSDSRSRSAFVRAATSRRGTNTPVTSRPAGRTTRARSTAARAGRTRRRAGMRPTNSTRSGRAAPARPLRVGFDALDIDSVADRMDGGGVLGKTRARPLRHEVGHRDDGVDVGELAPQQRLVETLATNGTRRISMFFQRS